MAVPGTHGAKAAGIAFVTALAAALLAAPASAQAGDPSTIKIVSSLPRTGSANAQTTTIVNGIKLALEEAGWKAGEFKLKYEDLDDASPQRGNWDAAVEAANADAAVKDPDIMVYIGTYNSNAASISIPKLNIANLAMISPANTWPGLTKPGTGEPGEPEKYRPTGKINYFRVVPADDIQGAVAASWAKKLGAKTAFVLHDRELYGKGVADIFKAHAEKLGLTCIGYEGIDTKAANYKSLAAKVKGKGPDLVYFGGTTQSNGGQLLKDLRNGGFAGKFMVPDGCVEEAFIESAGKKNANETYATFGGLPADKLTGKGADFYKRYKETYKTEPEVYAVYGYECGKVAIDAIQRAGKKDRAAIVAAMAATKDFDGATGHWSFDANGDTSLKTMSGQIVKDGKFEFVEVLGGAEQ
jgi:branched-chain amino acid transport system substrate-binding protein